MTVGAAEAYNQSQGVVMFENLTDKLNDVFQRLTGKGRLLIRTAAHVYCIAK